MANEMNEFLNRDIILICYMLASAASFALICTGISYIIDAKGRFNYNTYWDDKDAKDDGNEK